MIMSELEYCISCGAEIEKETWVSKFGFCTSQHYVDYMSEHRLWSEGNQNYSQEHMNDILDRLGESIEETAEYPFYGIEKLLWLDNAIEALWVLVGLDLLYILLA